MAVKEFLWFDRDDNQGLVCVREKVVGRGYTVVLEADGVSVGLDHKQAVKLREFLNEHVKDLPGTTTFVGRGGTPAEGQEVTLQGEWLTGAFHYYLEVCGRDAHMDRDLWTRKEEES